MGVAVLRDVTSLTENGVLLEAAQRLSAQWSHPVDGCLYLALANPLSSPLVTADRRLSDQSREHQLVTHFIGGT